MLKLYQPTTKSGIIDLVYRNTGADSVKYPIEEVVADINQAKVALLMRAIETSGKWQVDDSNHTDYNIITTNLVAGQRDISFTTDENGNLILDIFRVMVADENGIFYDLDTVDQQSKNEDTLSMVDGSNATGRPTKYDKTANGIFFEVLPSYSYAGGVKLFINRDVKYYSVPTVGVADDTPSGLDPRLDEYLAVRPTAYYAQRKGKSNANFWANELLKYEGDENRGYKGFIQKIYGRRAKDEQLVFTPETINPF